jgi:Flp pilus assembly protein CpaB
VPRAIRPRRGLPGSRSVVGGLLVALAAVGTWWAAADAGRQAPPRYVVAATALAPGERIRATDVRTTAVDLPASLRARSFRSPGDVIGSVVLGPTSPGELLQSATVAPAPGATGARELSFPVDRARAVAGRLRSGDRIDVLATYGEGPTSQTVQVLSGATVRRVDTIGSDGLGDAGGQTVTVDVRDPAIVRRAVNATRAATLTVVRATGAEPAPTGERYRAGSDLGKGGS